MRRVCRQMRRAHTVISRTNRLEIRTERRLGVHDQLTPAWQPHHQIGPLHPIFAAHRDLRFEITIRQHAGQLTHAAQLQFAPLPAHRRRAECLRQLLCLLTQRLTGQRHGIQSFTDRTSRLRLCPPDMRQHVVVARQRIADRGQQFGDVPMSLGQRRFRFESRDTFAQRRHLRARRRIGFEPRLRHLCHVRPALHQPHEECAEHRTGHERHGGGKCDGVHPVLMRFSCDSHAESTRITIPSPVNGSRSSRTSTNVVVNG